MKLRHFSAEPLGSIRSVQQYSQPYFKPTGFWISDESDTPSWSEWCWGNDFNPDGLSLEYEIELSRESMVLHIKSDTELDYFHDEYTQLYTFDYKKDSTGLCASPYIDWAAVAKKYKGILITPYRPKYRFSIKGASTWYTTWDCASGCIWDASAIQSIQLISHHRLSEDELR